GPLKELAATHMDLLGHRTPLSVSSTFLRSTFGARVLCRLLAVTTSLRRSHLAEAVTYCNIIALARANCAHAHWCLGSLLASGTLLVVLTQRQIIPRRTLLVWRLECFEPLDLQDRDLAWAALTPLGSSAIPGMGFPAPMIERTT